MKPAGHPFALACLLACGIGTAGAGGVAALKEQPFHEDASASAVVYSRIIESQGPYLRIVAGGADIDLLRSKLVGRIELPDRIPQSLLEETDVAPLRVVLGEVRKFSARYPRSARLLEKHEAGLAAHLGRFDAGEVRFEGAWITRKEFVGILEERRVRSEARERTEIEKRVFEATQRDKGLVLHDGKWRTRQEIERIRPEAPTESSAAMEPLGNGDLEGARSAVTQLSDLAARQTGAPKVRTERLLTAVKNLFLAEARYRQQLIAHAGEGHEAALHDKNAREWLKPNAFGTVSKEAAKDSKEKAKAIRVRSADDLAAARQALLDQLREADVVTTDFHQLGEHRVVWILGKAVRAVAARHFGQNEFRSSFPDATLAAIRGRIEAENPLGTPP